MTLKQDCLHFVVCPKQGMYFRVFVVLNRARVSNPQRLTSTLILVEYPPLQSRGATRITCKRYWFFQAGLRFTTTWQDDRVNFFFVNFAWKKSLVRSRGKRFCFCPLHILPLPQIMKKRCWCHSNIIFEDVWQYVFAPLGETQCWGDCSCLGPKSEIKTCFNGLMGHVDLKKLQIALSPC